MEDILAKFIEARVNKQEKPVEKGEEEKKKEKVESRRKAPILDDNGTLTIKITMPGNNPQSEVGPVKPKSKLMNPGIKGLIKKQIKK